MRSWNHVAFEAMRFLDSIMELEEKLPENIEGMREILERNLNKLKEIERKMVMMGFETSFLPFTLTEREELEPREKADVAKQIRRLRMEAMLKRLVLERVRIAISAHKIAIEHLKEHEKKGVARISLIPFLPLSGAYALKFERMGLFGRVAYRDLLSMLSLGEREVSYLMFDVEVDGKKRRIVLPEGVNYEKIIKERFGSDARILRSRVYRRRTPLVSGRVNRLPLAISYAFLALERAKREVKISEKLKKYVECLEKHGLRSWVRVDRLSGLEKLKEELEREGLMRNGALLEEVEEELIKGRFLLKEKTIEIARRLLLEDLFKFYLFKNRRERKRSSLFPRASLTLDFEQLMLFDTIKLKKAKASEILRKKFAIEEKLQRVNVPSLYIGAIALALAGEEPNVSKEKLSRFLEIASSVIDVPEEIMEKYGVKKPSERAREFLEKVKKVEKDKRKKGK